MMENKPTLRFSFSFSLLITGLLLLSGCAGSPQASSPANSMGSTPSATMTSPSPGSVNPANPPVENDVLRVGDSLSIRLTGVPVEDQEQLSEDINDKGEISMPLVGNFQAAGKTISALTAEIITAYREKKIYNNPSILIVPLQRFVNVGGEVRNPQRITYTLDLTVLKAISACGSFTDYADRKKIKILRGQNVIYFNSVDAFKDPSLDFPLQAGDQVQVARTIF
jgi:polysaccharide export outer membrane protein